MDDTYDMFSNVFAWLRTTVVPLLIGLGGLALIAFVQRTAQISADIFWGLFSKKKTKGSQATENQKETRETEKMCGTKAYPKEARERNVRLTNRRNDVLRKCENKDFNDYIHCR